MSTDDFISVLGRGVTIGGVCAVLLFILGRVIFKVGDRMISAIDRIGADIREHTRLDLEHHADVREAVTRLEGTVDALAWQDRTPVRTPNRGIRPPRKPTNGTEE